DPSDFWLRTFLPRAVGALEPLKELTQLTPMVGIPVFYFIQYGRPDIQRALQTLMDAGREGMKWQKAVMEFSQEALEAGFPSLWGGLSGAPFDMIGDFLRGTQGIMPGLRPPPGVDIEKLSPQAHSHDYDEILGFFGSDMEDIRDLGGEVELWLEDEKHIINKSCLVFIPKGMKHCPLYFKRIDKPIFHFSVGPGKMYF
ncbi:unnamed protein product, partial [marine sediment metagenome]